jgi:predicted secreted protein
MATGAKSGFGSTFKRSAVAVAEIKAATHSGHRLDLSDVTNMDSTAGFAEFIASVAHGGQVDIEGNLINTGAQASMISDLDGKTSATYELVLGSPAVITISGTAFVTDFQVTGRFDEAIQFSATVVYTGQPTIT